ncbi:fumarylacetoacetate hydrolase family protein [Streptomyces hygroscopicus]|uniref:fumarylacetoacetate hydrolase family protein n=1 Tax=Streptomyces hygroscopicus TaxID=1912 RepID=UPI0038083DE5
MRIANLNGRAHLLSGPGAIDTARASGGRFGPDPMDLFAHWDAFRTWVRTDGVHPAAPYRREDLGAPVPRPRQVFAIGLNYAEHAAETGLEAAKGMPSVFTKFTSSLTGPAGTVHLTGPSVDWEVELVVSIGKAAQHVAAADAWEHVAGVMVGQDFSDRDVQMSGTPPQFSLGKSYPGFGPTGPALVSLDETAPDTPLRLRCWVNDELVQDGSALTLAANAARAATSSRSGYCSSREHSRSSRARAASSLCAVGTTYRSAYFATASSRCRSSVSRRVRPTALSAASSPGSPRTRARM